MALAPGPTIKNKRQSLKNILKNNGRQSLILENKVDPKNICETIKYFVIINDSVTGQIISVDSGQSLALENT